MAVTDKKADNKAKFVRKEIVVPLSLLTAATTEVEYKWTPGYAFEVLEIRSYCKSNTNVTFQVKVGGRSALSGGSAATPVALTDTKHAIHATMANVNGSATEALSVEAISGATPALPAGSVTVVIRAHPIGADAS